MALENLPGDDGQTRTGVTNAIEGSCDPSRTGVTNATTGRSQPKAHTLIAACSDGGIYYWDIGTMSLRAEEAFVHRDYTSCIVLTGRKAERRKAKLEAQAT